VTSLVGSQGDVLQLMDQMPYGLYIVGSRDAEGSVNGMMADWLMQVSFEPRLVGVAFEEDSHTLANIRANQSFTVNFLCEDDAGRALAAKFAQPYFGSKVGGRGHGGRLAIHHKLEDVAYRQNESGCPIVEGALGWLECKAEGFFQVGDHTLVTGRVVNGGVLREGEPLTSSYAGWSYSG
jgi:flavin reductase (DIM6/NTAB) family NADH-FMN oxidoreductase RutF